MVCTDLYNRLCRFCTLVVYKPRASPVGGAVVLYSPIFSFYCRRAAYSDGRMTLPRVTLLVISVISIATALVCVSFLSQPDSELELTMPSVTRWVCMGCQQPNRHGAPGQGSYFADYKSAVCPYARSAACNKSNRGLRTVTIVSRPSDRDVGGGGGAGTWPPRKGAI